ncbi:hypothetical protein C8R43DRAFT_961432 [Mycena crocata]|nr:hypothetical protein C8R43DRAFT_961432 [Mycena crocata]
MCRVNATGGRCNLPPFAAGGQPLAGPAIPRTTGSLCFTSPACRSHRVAAAVSFTISIDVSRAASRENLQVHPHLEFHSATMLTPSFRTFCRRRPTSRYNGNSPDSPLALVHVLALREPPRSGGHINCYMYRRPANKVLLQKICRRRPTPAKPSRWRIRNNGYVILASRRRVAAATCFVAGGQHLSTTANRRIHPKTSRERGKIAELLPPEANTPLQLHFPASDFPQTHLQAPPDFNAFPRILLIISHSQRNEGYRDFFRVIPGVHETYSRNYFLVYKQIVSGTPSKSTYSVIGHQGKRNDKVEHHCYWREEDWHTRWGQRSKGGLNNPMYTRKIIKYGEGSMKLWGCITRRVLKTFILIQGITNCFIYAGILPKQILGIGNHHIMDFWIISFL